MTNSELDHEFELSRQRISVAVDRIANDTLIRWRNEREHEILNEYRPKRLILTVDGRNGLSIKNQIKQL